MRPDGKKSYLKRLFSRAPEVTDAVEPAESLLAAYEREARRAAAELTEQALEQAYRNLLVENLVLQETNDRLGAELAQGSDARDKAFTDQRLIVAQRNALAERGRRMRQVEYELKQIKRRCKRLLDEKARLEAGLAEQQNLIAALREKQRLYTRELDEAKVALSVKASEFRMLRDKYQTLQLDAARGRARAGSGGRS
jgi:chromosome segregation ATPase